MKILNKAGNLFLSVGIAIGLCMAPLNATSQTVDELLKRIGPGVMSHTYQFCCDIKPVVEDAPFTPGVVTFRLRIVPHWICDTFQVDVVEVDNLKYFGEMSWTFEASAGDTLYFPITVEIPANDTTGMKFEIWGCECKHYARAYFAATDEIVDFYPGDPRGSTKVKRRAWRDAYQGAIERARDSIAQLPPPHPPVRLPSRLGFFDKDGYFYPGDSVPLDFEPWTKDHWLASRGADYGQTFDTVESIRDFEELLEARGVPIPWRSYRHSRNGPLNIDLSLCCYRLQPGPVDIVLTSFLDHECSDVTVGIRSTRFLGFLDTTARIFSVLPGDTSRQVFTVWPQRGKLSSIEFEVACDSFVARLWGLFAPAEDAIRFFRYPAQTPQRPWQQQLHSIGDQHGADSLGKLESKGHQ